MPSGAAILSLNAQTITESHGRRAETVGALTTQACTSCLDDMYLDGSVCTADEGVGSENFEKPRENHGRIVRTSEEIQELAGLYSWKNFLAMFDRVKLDAILRARGSSTDNHLKSPAFIK